MPTESDLSQRLRDAFAWRGANNADGAGRSYADDSGWWADPNLLQEIGPALAALHSNAEPTLVAGIEAMGFLIGPLVAVALGLGFVEVRKGGKTGEELISRVTPPDYNERDLTLSVRRRRLRPSDHVLLVDEWIVTGAQATAAKRLIEDAGSHYVGLAAIVDATDNRIRRDLNLRSLITLHGLG